MKSQLNPYEILIKFYPSTQRIHLVTLCLLSQERVDFLQLMMNASREDKSGTHDGEREAEEEGAGELREETQDGSRSDYRGRGGVNYFQMPIVLRCRLQYSTWF